MKPNAAIRYSGEVVYIYAFDVAYDTARKPIRELLGQPVAQFAVDASKRSPRQLFFYKPQMVRLPPMERIGPLGPVRVERVIKLLPVGAISITVRVPFAVEHVEELVAFHDLQFSNGSLHDEVRQLAQEVVARTARTSDPAAAAVAGGGSLHGLLHRLARGQRRRTSRSTPSSGFRRIAGRSPRCSRRKNTSNAFRNRKPRNPPRVF